VLQSGKDPGEPGSGLGSLGRRAPPVLGDNRVFANRFSSNDLDLRHWAKGESLIFASSRVTASRDAQNATRYAKALLGAVSGGNREFGG